MKSLPDIIRIVSLLTGGKHEVMVREKQLPVVREPLSSLGAPERVDQRFGDNIEKEDVTCLTSISLNSKFARDEVIPQ